MGRKRKLTNILRHLSNLVEKTNPIDEKTIVMSNPLIHECNDYLVLEPGSKEQLLSKEATLIWLENWLDELDELPKDLENEQSTYKAAKRLLDTACDLAIKPGFTLQCFAVRLEPPER